MEGSIVGELKGVVGGMKRVDDGRVNGVGIVEGVVMDEGIDRIWIGWSKHKAIVGLKWPCVPARTRITVTTVIAELLATLAIHVVAPRDLLGPAIALGTLLELHALCKLLE